ncbi:MAG: hypothetical protein ACOYXY_01850 [Thermodesulfobacteriota bacterium]
MTDKIFLNPARDRILIIPLGYSTIRTELERLGGLRAAVVTDILPVTCSICVVLGPARCRSYYFGGEAVSALPHVTER